MEILRLLIGTVELRPYVFIFFGIYLFIAISNIGLKRTALFTVLAYCIAFVCEYSSSHSDLGIPFGVYKYIQSTRGRELWIAGVPFMDSLSFTFLSYISYELARFLLAPKRLPEPGSEPPPSRQVRQLLTTAALAGFLMMYLDIIIDPVTLQGRRWFLGEIYSYPDGGPYFGVTLANFAGWFMVCLLIVIAFFTAEKLIWPRESGMPGRAPANESVRYGERSTPVGKPGRKLVGDLAGEPVGPSPRAQSGFNYPLKRFAPAGLYFGILGFNLAVTFYIGEVTMGLVGVFICLPLLLMVILAEGNRTRINMEKMDLRGS
jgi:uncharacterized membrane protein